MNGEDSQGGKSAAPLPQQSRPQKSLVDEYDDVFSDDGSEPQQLPRQNQESSDSSESSFTGSSFSGSSSQTSEESGYGGFSDTLGQLRTLVSDGVVTIPLTESGVEEWTKNTVKNLSKRHGADLDEVAIALRKEVFSGTLAPVLEQLLVISGRVTARFEIRDDNALQYALNRLKNIVSMSFCVSQPLRLMLTKSLSTVVTKVLNTQFSFNAMSYVSQFLLYIADICAFFSFFNDPENPRFLLRRKRNALSEEEKNSKTPAQKRAEDKQALDEDVSLQIYRLWERALDTTKTFYRRQDTNNTILIQTINRYHADNGFDRLAARINSEGVPLSPVDVLAMLRPVEIVRSYFRPEFIAEFVDSFVECECQRICSFKVEDMEGLERDIVSSLLRAAKTVFQNASYGGKEKCHVISLHLSNLLLRLPQLDMRILGLRELNDMIGDVSASTFSPRSVKAVPEMVRWLEDNKVIDVLFDIKTVHPEIEKRAAPILQFLAQNNALSNSQLELVWKCATKPGIGDALQGATYDLLVALSPTLSNKLWQYLDSLFSSLNLVSLTSTASSSELFHAFLVNFLKRAASSSRFVLNQHLAEPSSTFVPPCCLTFIWCVLIRECHDKNVSQEALNVLNAFCDAILSVPTAKRASVFSDKVCEHFLGLALDGVVEGSNCSPFLMFLARFFCNAHTTVAKYEQEQVFTKQTLKFVQEKGMIDILLETVKRALGSENEETIVGYCFDVLKNLLLVILSSFGHFNSLVKQLWSLLAANVSLRKQLFEFLAPLLCGKTQQSIWDTELFVVTEALPGLDVAAFGQCEWSFFEALFCDINQREGHLSGPWVLHDPNEIELVGMNTFWRIALEACDEDVASLARQRLLLISRPVTLRQDSSQVPYYGPFTVQAMEYCFEQITNSVKHCKDTNAHCIQCHALCIINDLVKEGEKVAALENTHIHQSVSLPFSISLRHIKRGMKTVEVCGGDTVEHLCELASELFDIKDKNRIVLVAHCQQLRDDTQTLQQCFIDHETLVVVLDMDKRNIRSATQYVPQTLDGIFMNKSLPTLLFDILKQPNCSSELRKIAFDLLCVAPTDVSISRKLCGKGNISEDPFSDCSLPGDSQTVVEYLQTLWDPTMPEVSLPKLLYALISVDALVSNDPEWCSVFIAENGIGVLLQVLATIPAGQQFGNESALLILLIINKLCHGNESVVSFLCSSSANVCSVVEKVMSLVDNGEESFVASEICKSAFSLLGVLAHFGGESDGPLFSKNVLEWLYKVLAWSANPQAREAALLFIVNTSCPAKENTFFVAILGQLLNKLKEIPEMEHCEQYSQCVCTLLKEYANSETAPEWQHPNSADFVVQLVEMLKNRPVVEQSENSGPDCQLGAILSIMYSLVFTHALADIAVAHGIVPELLMSCLMDVPTKENHGSHALPKCKTEVSRSLGFALLQQLVQSGNGAASQVYACIKPIVHVFAPRRLRWRYTPALYKRASCGFSGLVNQGCTCYMNSVLQQVFMTSDFRNKFLQLSTVKEPSTKEHVDSDGDVEESDDEDAAEYGEVESEKLVPRLQRLFSRMISSERNTQDTKAFVCTLTHDGQSVNPYEQMDAEEFLTSLLDKIEDYAKASGNEGVVREAFYGKFCRQMIPSGCPHKRESDEQFISLQLDVQGKKRMEDSLAAFFESEVFSDYLCEECNQRHDTTRRCLISQFPKTLFVQCKRFAYDFETMRRNKITDEFVFPDHLDLSPYTREGTTAPNYTLVGVVVHTGSAESGHYYSYIRDRADENDKWYWFNDSSVTPFDPAQIPQECFGGTETASRYDPIKCQNCSITIPKVRSAYLLVYEQLGSNEQEHTRNATLQESEVFINPKTFDDIWKDNFEFLTDVAVIDTQFFNTVISSVERLLAPASDAMDCCTAQDLERATKVLTKLTFDVMVCTSDVESTERACKVLQTAFERQPILSSWFLDKSLDANWVERVMSRCPLPRTRTAVLSLMPVLFRHACEAQSDLLQVYSPPPPCYHSDEDDKDEDVIIKEHPPKKSSDPLLQDWPLGKARTPVGRFMDSYLKKLRSVSSSWKTFEDYFSVIKEFALVGPKEREYLLSRHTVGMLVDLYLNEESPIAKECKRKREHMGDKKSVPVFTHLFDALAACIVDLPTPWRQQSESVHPGHAQTPMEPGGLPVIDGHLFLGTFIRAVIHKKEESPGLFKILCQYSVGSLSRLQTVLDYAMSSLSVPGYRGFVRSLVAVEDSLGDRRTTVIVEGVAKVASGMLPACCSASYASDRDREEALSLLLDLVSQGSITAQCMAETCGPCISSCIVTYTSKVIRGNALLLVKRCASDPIARSTILRRLLSAAIRAKPLGSLVEQDKGRLMEYAEAVEGCLVCDEQKREFGAQINDFGELISSVNSQGDSSKWKLLKTLLAGLENMDANVDKVLQCDAFVKTLGHWVITPETDSDDVITTYCRVVLLLAQRSREFVLQFMCREPMNSEKMAFLLLPELCQQAHLFPVSLALVGVFIDHVLSEPACGTEFVQRFVEAIVSFRNQEIMAMAVQKIWLLSQQHPDVCSAAFWKKETIACVIKGLQENVECFVPICRLLRMFVGTIPDIFKSSTLKYCMAAYRFHTACAPPLDGSTSGTDDDVEAILGACLNGEWSKDARLLFEVLTSDPLQREPSQTMVFPCGVLDRAVQRVVKDGVAALAQPSDSSIVKRTLGGLCVAYLAMCPRDVPELPALVAQVRCLLAPDETDVLPNIGLSKTTRVVLLSLDSPAYSGAVAELLAACYAKSDLMESKAVLAPVVSRAVEIANGFSDDAAIIQKVCILCHSPVLAELFAPHLFLLSGVSARAGERGLRDMQEIQMLCQKVSPKPSV